MAEEQALETVDQIRFFGETKTEVVHQLFNAITRSWAKVIDEKAIPAIAQVCPMVGEDEKNDLKQRLLGSIIQHGKIYQILYKSENALNKIMALPKGLVIPGDDENEGLNEENTPEEKEMLSEISDLMAQVVRLTKEKDELTKLKEDRME